jgi:hypothetical protein
MNRCIEAAKGDQDAGDDVRSAEILWHRGEIVPGKRRERLAFAITACDAGEDEREDEDGKKAEDAFYHALPSLVASSASRSASTTVVSAIGVRTAWAARDSACDDRGLVIRTKTATIKSLSDQSGW